MRSPHVCKCSACFSNTMSVFTELNLWHYRNMKYDASLTAPQQFKSLWWTTSDLRYCHFLKHTVNMRFWNSMIEASPSANKNQVLALFCSLPAVLHQNLLVKQSCLLLYIRNSFFLSWHQRCNPCSWQPSYKSATLLQDCCNLNASKGRVKWVENYPRSFHWGEWKKQFPKLLAGFFLP